MKRPNNYFVFRNRLARELDKIQYATIVADGLSTTGACACMKADIVAYKNRINKLIAMLDSCAKNACVSSEPWAMGYYTREINKSIAIEMWERYTRSHDNAEYWRMRAIYEAQLEGDDFV